MSENPAPGTPSPLNYGTGKPGEYTGGAPSKEETNMATLMYILAIFTGFIGPLIIWLLKKDQSPFVNDQGKEVLNWMITVIAALICCMVLMIVLIGIFLMPIVLLANVIFMIIGALKVNQGIAYRFPFAIRLLK